MFCFSYNCEEDGDGEEDGTVESGDGCDSDWGGWISGQWPKAASDMKEWAGK